MTKDSKLLFKYTDWEGVKSIIQNSSLRFSSPCVFNDPFDMEVSESIIGKGPEDWMKELRDNFVENLTNTPSQEIDSSDKNLTERMRLLQAVILNLPQEKRDEFQSELIRRHNVNEGFVERCKTTEKECLANFREALRDIGVLCLTGKKDNILMWAHYAHKHQGAVLGFEPNISKDSVLGIAKPVNYSSERPVFFNKSFEMLNVMKYASDKLMKFNLTKSKEWEYEEELRIWIPGVIKNGKKFYDHKFYPEELVEIYLGCRMNNDQKDQLISMAILLNKDVKIYDSKLDGKSYKLNFFRIS